MFASVIWKRHAHLVDRLPQGLPDWMPHRVHVPRAGQFDTLEAELGDAMHLGDRRFDVTVREAGEADVAVGIVATELVHPRVIDAQHLVGSLSIVQLRRRGENAVDDLGVDAVAVHLLDAQMRVPRAANAFLAVLVEAGGRHHVDPELLARHVLRPRRAHPARQAEGRSVVGDPSGPVRPIGHVGHAVLQRAGRLRYEQLGGQPDQVEVTIGRDSVVVHDVSSTRYRFSASGSMVAPRPGRSSSRMAPASSRTGSTTTSPAIFSGPTASQPSMIASLTVATLASARVESVRPKPCPITTRRRTAAAHSIPSGPAPDTLILAERKPRASHAVASRAACSGGTVPIQALNATSSFTRPPRSEWTGRPRARALRSMRAISTAAIAS